MNKISEMDTLIARRTTLVEQQNGDRSSDLRPVGQRVVNVFVHLAVDKDAAQWRDRHRSGSLVGLNDDTPYGYGRARAMRCEVTFSESQRENAPLKFVRLAIRALTGFDFVHAWRNRAAIFKSDIVWTHTESQYLAIAALSLFTGKRVRIIGQSIWLIDKWQSLWWPHRTLVRKLVTRVDAMSFHSPINAAQAKALFPAARVEIVKFGIPAEFTKPPRCEIGPTIRVLALGNDRHRDWETLIDAVKNVEGLSLRILSRTVARHLARGAKNVEISVASTNETLNAAFSEANLVCVPLQLNSHASGITVVQEAVLLGLPVIATDVGGLSSYFTDDEITYVPIGDVRALREAILQVASQPHQAIAKARRAQRRMGLNGELGADHYVRRHVELSREILEVTV